MIKCPNCGQWELKQTDDFCALCGSLNKNLQIEPPNPIIIPSIGNKRTLTITNQSKKKRNINILPENPNTNTIQFSPSTPLEINPGKSTQINIQLQNPNEPDIIQNKPIQKINYLLLIDNDKNKTLPLPITIKKPPTPLITPNEITLQKENNNTKIIQGSINIKNTGGIPLTFNDISIIGLKDFQISPQPPLKPLKPNESITIKITGPTNHNIPFHTAFQTTGKTTSNTNNTGLKITFKNYPKEHLIPIHGQLPQYLLQTSPTKIDIPEALSKETHSQRITLTNHGAKNIEITNITTSHDDWLKIITPSNHFILQSHNTPPIDPNNPNDSKENLPTFKREFVFDVVIFPKELPHGRQTGTVTVHTGPETPDISIQVELYVIRPTTCEEYIGIDFGTSNSVVAIWHEGETVVVKDKKSDSALIPSVLVFHGRADNYKIGTEAEKEAATYPEMSVRSIKRVMGYGNERVFFDKKFWPEDLAALIIKKLVEYAEHSLFQLNKNHPNAYYDIRKAIVTVPANFYDLQIRGILEACEKAGIDTEEKQVKAAAQHLKELMGHDINEGIILDEPTAAALFFLKLFQENGDFEEEFDNKFSNNEDINLLIYDYGGGTLDVSVVQVLRLPEDAIGVRALANKGDNRIGGDSIDLAVMNKLLELCCEAFPKFDPSLLRLNYPQLEERKRKEKWPPAMWAETMGIRAKWKKAAEDLKITLSNKTETEFQMPGDYLIAKNGDSLTHIDGTFKKKITRKTLTGWIKGILGKSKTLIHEALTLSDLEDKDIDYIIHTGRSSLMPQVRETVREALPSVDDAHDILYEEHLKVCVAKGAVIYALLRSQVCVDQGVRIVSGGRKLPHSYGIQVNKGFKQLFEPIIPRGATYPVEQEKTYPTVPGRHFVQVRFLQNAGMDNAINKNNRDIREIGSITIDTRKNGKPGYDVAFVIDANRKIEVWADNEEVEIRPVRLEDEERWIC